MTRVDQKAIDVSLYLISYKSHWYRIVYKYIYKFLARLVALHFTPVSHSICGSVIVWELVVVILYCMNDKKGSITLYKWYSYMNLNICTLYFCIVVFVMGADQKAMEYWRVVRRPSLLIACSQQKQSEVDVHDHHHCQCYIIIIIVNVTSF